MSNGTWHKLRRTTRALLKRVEGPVRPAGGRTRFMSREEFLRHIGAHQADAGLRRDLRSLTADETTDLPPR